MKGCIRILGPIGAVAIVSASVLASTASAAVMSIPANTFVLRCASGSCPDGGTDADGESGQGLLQNAKGKYYAPVSFPTTGQYVCSFTVWYRDFDETQNITAKLFRKRAEVGISAFSSPGELASLSSGGTPIDTLQKLTTSTIATPLINTTKFFYYVELQVDFSTLQVLGVQVDYRATCP